MKLFVTKRREVPTNVQYRLHHSLRADGCGSGRGERSRGRARRTLPHRGVGLVCVTVADMITNVHKPNDITIYGPQKEKDGRRTVGKDQTNDETHSKS